MGVKSECTNLQLIILIPWALHFGQKSNVYVVNCINGG